MNLPGDLGIVLTVIVILENAIDRSPANFQLRLLVARLYTLLGIQNPSSAY